MRPRLLLAALLLTATAACSQDVGSAVNSATDTAAKTRDCARLAQEVASTGLGSIPSLAEAEQAVRRLDEQVAGLDNEEVRAAAGTLRDRLEELVTAARQGDAAAIQAAADSARTAAENTARTCGLPADRFLPR